MSPKISFVDSEIDAKSGRIVDLGAIRIDGATFHNNAPGLFRDFIAGSEYVVGHNILRHDLKYLGALMRDSKIDDTQIIDTLFLSPLLFPARPYHAFAKDDKFDYDEINNPLSDAVKAKDLFHDEVTAFNRLDEKLKAIYYCLVKDRSEFATFFKCIGYTHNAKQAIEVLIQELFKGEICEQIDLQKLIADNPIELIYCLALINARSRYSITPRWVLKNFPRVDRIMHTLRNTPCLTGCSYCNKSLDVTLGLKSFFGFDSFRTYAGEPLQEKSMRAAVHNKSLLAVFPTGGGKSLTFQVPALMAAENTKGLTVVISPLQSLMKDQVDNLERANITTAVTINGLLDPIERAKSFERVEDGSAALLYISPESLRSKSIENLLLGRKIARVVIDEAHCFSAWGQDFRVDYLYIGDFIKELQIKKNLEDSIPVSCFTATAKQRVIEDIQKYFKDKLNLDLELFTSKASRTNLQYKVVELGEEEDKYNTVRELVEEKNCPTIVYVSRTNTADVLAARLRGDGFNAKAFHGKMDVSEKTTNQDEFIKGTVQIMVATSAFGMGVDKRDIGLVIHYEISDSLENYIQEAGRAGRDEAMTADCFVLFNEEDLGKHFVLLNQTKLSIREIQQVWTAIKDITRYRAGASNSALEIARKAGWDDNIVEIETRVVSAIAALEDAGYLKRGQNMPRIFANSIISKNAQEAIDKITASSKFNEAQKKKGTRIIKKLFSTKSRKHANDEVAESRVDYISDHLGIVKEEVINIITLMREEKILADAKDLTAYIRKAESKAKSSATVDIFCKLESFLFSVFEEEENTFHIKDLNSEAETKGCTDSSTARIKALINFWAIKNWIKRQTTDYSRNHMVILCAYPKEKLKEKMDKRHVLAKFLINYLHTKVSKADREADKDEVLVEFSVHELKAAFEKEKGLFDAIISLDDIEDTLFFLSKIEAIKIEGGFLVVYNKLTIERLEQDTRKRYKIEDYQKLEQYYDQRVQQIHIVGEYAKKMIADYKSALQFVEDYFQLNFTSFLNKHFNRARQSEIKQNITPAKFRELFGDLSPIQLGIVKDQQTKYMVVAAGPGSGKTKVLVHKLASLMLMEDVKHEQLLMVTFSRAAANEFKKRLYKLIGGVARYIDVKTFHSYCFDLLGKTGTLEKSQAIVGLAVEKIQNGEVEQSKITKTVLVIDEAQDMDAHEFALINALIEKNDDMRVIAVGDDDQNIYEWRGSSARHLIDLVKERDAVKHELIDNYRSKENLVRFTNQFVRRIPNRLKQNEIVAVQRDNGFIKLVKHHHRNLTVPLVNDILTTPLTGSTCVLTNKNEEALQITGLLLKNGVKAKLIQSNDGFNLYNLLEVRYFFNELKLYQDDFTIPDDAWADAKKALLSKFGKSTKLEICQNLIKEFVLANPKRKYKSDLEMFIRESELENFYTLNNEIIAISTIHKAKGKEFDNVFLMLQNAIPEKDEENRKLYVGMTRAKTNLNIHLIGNYLDDLKADNLTRTEDKTNYPVPGEMAMHLTLKDIWLNYSIDKQVAIDSLVSGDPLIVNGSECFNSKNQSILRFSNSCKDSIDKIVQHGYTLKSAKVNFVVYWTNEEFKREVKIVLPELYFVVR